MIQKITIRSFKSLADCEIELGSINVFIGANGSGKSNLLEAVGVLGAAASGRIGADTLRVRGVRLGVPALYKTSFRGVPLSRHIHLTAKNANSEYRVGLWNPIANPETDWEFKTESWTHNQEAIVGRSPKEHKIYNLFSGVAALKVVTRPVGDPAIRFLKTLQDYAIYSPDTDTLRGLRQDTLQRAPVGLSGGRLPEAFREIMRDPDIGTHTEKKIKRQALYRLIDWMGSINVATPEKVPLSPDVPRSSQVMRFEDKFMSSKRNVISGYDASEGALYLLYGLVLALHPRAPDLLAIDNFDQALNPRTAREMTRVFCDWILEREGKQVLLTTHNPLVLDGLPLTNGRVRLFAVDRDSKGCTVVNPVILSPELLEQAGNGVPLSSLWVQGFFGGVPSNV